MYDLRILPVPGKIVITAGSPGVGTRGTQAIPHYTTRFGVEIQEERLLSHGYASGITCGYQDESPCGDLWLLCLKLVTLHNLITL